MTEPVTKLPRRGADLHTVNEWLDAVATGTCDETEFFRGVGELIRRAPDTGWELLALLDQYYRRGKITVETFSGLKGRLQNLLMGKNGEGQAPPRSAPAAVSRPAAVPSPVRPVAVPTPRNAPPTTSTTSTTSPIRASTLSDFGAAHADDDWESDERDEQDLEPEAYAEDEPESRTQQTSMAAGRVLRGRYRILGVLGEGGMGTVYEAVDEYRVDRADEERRVAVKVLNSKVTHRPRLFAELRREFQHLQTLSHPNIVRVHEFDRDGEVAFFTMERLHGALLSRVLSAHRAQAMFRPYAFAIIRDVGAAVVHAHARSIVHGDVNPVNVFITDEGEVRVLDFGAAHPLRRGPWISDFEGDRRDQPMATPRYASVQLLEGETADARDDIYALACVSYELLTGKHPFREQSALKARSLRIKPSRPGGLNARQWRALKAALRFERDRRPPDLQTWLNHLLPPTRTRLPRLPQLLEAAPRSRSGFGWLAAAACVLCIALAAWWAGTHQDVVSEIAGRSAEAGVGAARAARQTVDHLWAQRDAVVFDTPAKPDSGVMPLPGALSEATRDAARAPVETSIESHDGLRDSQPGVAPPTARTASVALPTPVTRPPPGAVAPVAARAATQPTTNDNAGGPHARIELAADTVEVVAGEPMARVLVKRSRSTRGDVSFTWWTESGTAKPGRDFALVKPEVETIPNGKNATTLFIPIVADPARRESRSFYVVIDEPSDTATLGRTLTMVTIPELE